METPSSFGENTYDLESFSTVPNGVSFESLKAVAPTISMRDVSVSDAGRRTRSPEPSVISSSFRTWKTEAMGMVMRAFSISQLWKDARREADVMVE